MSKTTAKKDQPTSGKVFYSEFICKLLSSKNIGRLERSVGRYNVGFLFIRIAAFYSSIEAYGAEAGLKLLRESEEEINTCFRIFFPGCEMIFTEQIGLNEYLLCFHLSDKQVFNLPNQALSFRAEICERIICKANIFFGQKSDVLIGYSWTGRQHKDSFYETVFKVVCEAQRIANLTTSVGKPNLRSFFVELLEKSLLQCVYQPVVHLKTGNIFGWEAFVRGPEKSHFHQPASLYSYASEIGMTALLDRKCAEQAIRSVGNFSSDQHLFINIHTESLNAESALPEMMKEWAAQHRADTESIVLEFSEVFGIRDYPLFLENIRKYRDNGFKIAIDEIGHSTPMFISHIRPDYLKIDASLIRGIGYYPVKEAIVEGFVMLCERIGAKLIAVGIETETELRTLISLGVQFGQGYYLAKPSYPKSSETIALPPGIGFSGNKPGDMKFAAPVRQIIAPPILIPPETTVAQVKELLKDRSPLSGVVIASRDKPKGLLMSYHMDRQLGTLYGVSLFYNRQVSLLMDHEPMIVEANQSLGEVARAAMSRPVSKIYDDIIVTELGVVIGTVSVQRMLETLAKIEIRARETAEAATKAKSNFLAAMSHDIRTPMNAILGMADLLMESPLTAEQEKYVRIFRNAGESLVALINDILDLSKVETGQMELENIGFDLRELVEKCCEIMAVGASQKNIALNCHISPKLPSAIQGDPIRLRQILSNLIGNAVKFTHKGEIAVRAEENGSDGQNIAIRFSVRDTGIGIPKDRQQDIFKSFTQAHSSTSREYGGTGLGLAICQHLVKLMQGKVWVESESGAGSTFYFTAKFPIQPCVCPAQSRSAEIAAEEESAETFEPLRILLAEDNENNRLLFGFYLKNTPYRIDIAENGMICVEKYMTGQYDIVFMDIEMPIMDGYKATDAIRTWEKEKQIPGVPIIALTAHALKGKRQESMDAGCTDYMPKPFKKHELLKILRKYSSPLPQNEPEADCSLPTCPEPLPAPKNIVHIDSEIRELIPGFLRLTQEEIRTLDNAVSEQNYEMIRRMGHRIKGACLCYGFDNMGEICRNIEDMGVRKEDPELIRNLVNELVCYIRNVEIVYEPSCN